MRMNSTSAYQEMMINSKLLEVPRGSYQRELNIKRVRKIAARFDPHLVNPPKVSYRNGHYYVFDGQHTIAVLKLLNGGKDLMIRCIVYTGMTESEEALLFAQQAGESAPLTPGDKMRAKIYGGDPECMAFLKATESVGLRLDYAQRRGKHRIGCIGTAFEELKPGVHPAVVAQHRVHHGQGVGPQVQRLLRQLGLVGVGQVTGVDAVEPQPQPVIVGQRGGTVTGVGHPGRGAQPAGVGVQHRGGQRHRLHAQRRQHRHNDRQRRPPETGQVVDAKDSFGGGIHGQRSFL